MADNDLDVAGAIKLLDESPESPEFLALIETDKEQTERELDFRLPPSYCRFLAAADGLSLIGRDMLKENLESRQAIDTIGWYLPEFLVAFYLDGSGDQYCFDTRRADTDGEYRIVHWSHELSTEEELQELTITESTFEKWLLRYTWDTCRPHQKREASWLERVWCAGCAGGCVVVGVLLILGLVTAIQWLWRCLS